ncbi:hypothetical protein MPSEU_000631600 [Mayamaea pseudoterrestris]|nr:hypothetical protein MPSEU_000631600 [Mayamaea pseudoterrestris]
MAVDEYKASPAAGSSSNETTAPRARKKRWGEAIKPSAGAETVQAAITVTATATDAKAKVLAMQESIRARLAAAKSKASATIPTTTAAALKRSAPDETAPHIMGAKRAKHFDLDLSQTAPTYKREFESVTKGDGARVTVEAAKPKSNPYLAHQENVEETLIEQQDERDLVYDPLLARAAKPRQRHKELSFVEPGYYQELAERKRHLAAKAQASGYVSGRKTGHTIHASNTWAGGASSTDYYAGSARDDDLYLPPRVDANPDRNMPLTMEWWDVELLPSKLKKLVAAEEAQLLTKRSRAAMMTLQAATVGDADKAPLTETTVDADQSSLTARLFQSCFEQASLMNSKTASLVQHIVPIRPPHFVESTQPPVLHLTKKELKRQRKLRRQAKQRELQDLQAAGLIAAPEPRLTLRNFIQVIGDQAYLDPSQMEQKVAEQMHKRQSAHLERNERQKLTKEERAEKRAKKLQEDTSAGVHVAVFYVKDMSHPYHRAKVDLNAQQLCISGGILECDNPKLACVVCEGGPKAIARFCRLMLVRMKWNGSDDAADDDDDDSIADASGLGEDGDANHVTTKFNPDNKCELVWRGMVVKRLFKGFSFQACETSDQARKALKSKGVEHYWDQVLAHAQGKRKDGFGLKLASNESDGEADNPYAFKDDDDIVVAEDN